MINGVKMYCWWWWCVCCGWKRQRYSKFFELAESGRVTQKSHLPLVFYSGTDLMQITFIQEPQGRGRFKNLKDVNVPGCQSTKLLERKPIMHIHRNVPKCWERWWWIPRNKTFPFRAPETPGVLRLSISDTLRVLWTCVKRQPHLEDTVADCARL